MDTIKRIQAIFREKFHLEVPEDDFSKNISLGATGVGFNAINMFYFINFIETEFNIQFTPEHFKSGIVRTLPGLCATIEGLKKAEAVEKV